MSIATVTTMGYSISGGLNAGTSTLPSLGYGISAPVPIDAGISIRASLGKHNVSAELEIHHVRATGLIPNAYREDEP